jgi:Cu(I)/Ag(I) efflux system membrane fusion protein
MKRTLLIVILAAAVVVLGSAVVVLLVSRPEAPPPGAAIKSSPAAETPGRTIEYYTCVMHPQVRQPGPGNCPICSMKLVPKYRETLPDSSVFVSPQKQQLIGLTTAEARMRTLALTIRAAGRVAYAEPRLAVVTLRTGGWIQSLVADFTGRFVRKGDPLFTVYSPELVSAEREYLLALAASQDSSSTPGLTDEGGDYSLLNTARERLRLWEMTDEQIAGLERTGVPLTEVPILSPISGYIVEKTAVRGMKAEAGAPLYRIADLSRVWVYADLYENEAPLAKTGLAARIEFPYANNRRGIDGKIAYVDPFLNPATRTLRVRLDVDNPGLMLKPEMFVDVKIATALGERLSVPHDAVLSGGSSHYVFVDRGNGYFQPRSVTLAGEGDSYTAIASGLSPGEKVVTSANFLLDSESRLKGVLDEMSAPSKGRGE